MNKRLDLSKLGGYPLSQKDLDWLQVSYRGALAGISGLIGDKVIISGMMEVSGTIDAGWISINNELVPFAAGTIATGEFIIDETSETLVFKDGNSKIVRYERVARFSVGGPYQYADLKRPSTIKDAWQQFDVKEIDCDLAYVAANFDGTGLGINERVGWAICNGNNGTKNRAGKVSVAYKPSDSDFDDTIKTGGSKTHTLDLTQIPAHNHKIYGTDNDAVVQPVNGELAQLNNPGTPGYTTTKNTETVGGGLPHNNMQPYFVSLHIMKL